MFGFASAMPLSISGTNSRGSLTNFFTSSLLLRVRASDARWAPRLADGLEDDGDGHGAGVDGVARALPRVRGAAPLGQHRLRGRRGLAGGGGGGLQRLGRRPPRRQLALQGVDGRD